MLQFKPAGTKWWNKPLVNYRGKNLPAELAVLQIDLQPDEQGVWLNSRGITTGVSGLLRTDTQGSEYKTQRIEIPDYESNPLKTLYSATGLKNGSTDLVIWNKSTYSIRIV